MTNRINTEQLLVLLDEGQNQLQCAAYFNVSASAISQKLTKLRRQAPSESFLRLPEKRQVFVLEKSSGKNNMEAARAAFDCTSDDSAKVLGSKTMQDPDVRLALSDLMAQEGLGRRNRIKRLKDMIFSEDFPSVGRGLDMSFKLDGSYAPEEVHVIQYDPVAARARYAELKGLLQEAIAVEGNVIDVEPEYKNSEKEN